MRLIVFVCAAALIAAISGGQSAHAKTPHWVITGGDLGGAWYFHGYLGPQTEVDLPGDATVLNERPEVGAAIVYDIYPSCGMVECIAVQMGRGRPPMRYFGGAGVLWGRPWFEAPADAWYRLTSEQVDFLESTIATAKEAAAEGRLPSDPIEAHLLGIGLHERSTFTFSPTHSPGVTFGLEQRSMLFISTPESGPFAKEALAETLRGGVRGQTAETPAWRIMVWVSWDNAGSGWGGPMGTYTPPFDGRLGRLSFGPLNLDGAPRDYWETTHDFDMVVAAALLREGVEVDWPAPPAAGSGLRSHRPDTVSSAGLALAALGAAAAALYWLKSITSRGGPASSKTR